MTREAIEYFKSLRKIFCEDHLKFCPKDSIAYQATLKEKEFYDMAIKALEQEPRKGYLSIDDVMSVFDDFMCGEVDEDGTEIFLEMLIDKAETEKT